MMGARVVPLAPKRVALNRVFDSNPAGLGIRESGSRDAPICPQEPELDKEQPLSRCPQLPYSEQIWL